MTEIQLKETPYQRYLRHYFHFEGFPGECRYCGAETMDAVVHTCEECYYRVYKIKKQMINVEPLQFNEPFYIEPAYKTYQDI